MIIHVCTYLIGDFYQVAIGNGRSPFAFDCVKGPFPVKTNII